MTDASREARFTALFEAHYDAVRAYAWRRDPATADDVAAETFLAAWRGLDRVPAASLPWLLGVARNVRLNMARGERRRARREAAVPGAAPATSPEPRGLPPDLRRALAALSARDRELVLLAAWEDLDPAGIARVVGCSRTTASVRLHRARRRLAAALAGPDVAPSNEGAADAC